MRHEPAQAFAITGSPVDRAGRTGRGWWLGLVLLWLTGCVWLLASRAGAIVTLRLPDSDDALRLLQVRDWLDGQGWYDLRQYRLDPPAGADIHWSRLVDLPLAAVIATLRPLIGAARADVVAAAAVPLATLLAAMALLAGLGRRLIAPGAWWWPPLLLLTASPPLDMMAPLRIDHHGWQIVTVLTAMLGLVARDRRRGGLGMGLAIAASLAIGVEMLPYLALGAALAALGWVADPREGARLRWLCLGAGGGTLTALIALVPPAQRLVPACDALSVAYAAPLCVAAAVLGAGAWRDRAKWSMRAPWVVAAGLAAGLVLLATGGDACLTDPYRTVDPVARALWLNRVSEALPLWRQTREVLWASLALPLIGLAGAAAMLRAAPAGQRRGWTAMLAVAVLAVLLALLSTRAAVAAQALALPGAAALGWRGRAWLAAHPWMPLRVFGSVALFLGVSAIAPRLLMAATLGVPPTAAEAAAATGAEACMAPAAMARLDALPPGTALALIDATPALLLHTHHRGLAGPYHRNGRAIADAMQAWGGTPAGAEAIVRRHRIAWVMLCGQPAETDLYDRRAPDGLHARLRRGLSPTWLAPVPLRGTPWRIWAVRPPLRADVPGA